MAHSTPSPTQVADKQIQRVSQSVDAVIQGIDRVSVSPTKLAADNMEKMLAGFTRAVQDGKIKRGLESVDLAEWQDKTKAKANRIPEGVRAARDKIIAFQDQQQAYQKGIDTTLAKMPNRSLSDALNRSRVQIEAMAKFQVKR